MPSNKSNKSTGDSEDNRSRTSLSTEIIDPNNEKFEKLIKSLIIKENKA